jgi:NADPH:quinone reductase-like Zn-dependent oxidoreductase
LKAITFNRHGDSDVLEYADVPTPAPAAGEVLVAVRAVSVNHGPDVETRRHGFSMGKQPMPHIGGVDPAGEIVDLGPGVSGFAIGERVAVYPVIACGVCDFCRAGAGENYCRNSRLFGVQTPGGRAEYVTAPITQLVRLPDGVSFEAAAALGVAYTTTWHGLIDRAQMSAEDTLLVMGAGGGCGVAAVQIAKGLGARVIAVTGSGWKQERLDALGADVVLSYQDDDWPQQVREATGGLGVTVAFDNAGTATLPASIDCLARAGKLICSGGTSGLEATINIRQLYRNHISLLFYVQGTKANMEKLVSLVASGGLEPVIDREYPLHDAALADDHLDSRDQFGRVVLRVESSPIDTENEAPGPESLVAGDR